MQTYREGVRRPHIQRKRGFPSVRLLSLGLLLALHVPAASASEDLRMQELRALAQRYAEQSRCPGSHHPSHLAWSQRDGHSHSHHPHEVSAVAPAPVPPLPGRAGATSGFLSTLASALLPPAGSDGQDPHKAKQLALQNLEGAGELLAGVAGHLHDGLEALRDKGASSVSDLKQALVATTRDLVHGNGLDAAAGAVLGPVHGALVQVLAPAGPAVPAASPLPYAAPPVPASSGSPGLVVGTAGMVGSVGQLLDSAGAGALFAADGYIRNGNLAVSAQNIQQGYAQTQVAGLPVVNLAAIGQMLDAAGNSVTGGNGYLTLIGGVTSDSYISGINNGDPGGLLGPVLPSSAPAWAQTCANVGGVVNVRCWAVNPAQNYQVLVGDGAYANGSKEVVIGTGARHQLPQVSAAVAFPGAGLNDPSNPTGVPTADYAARLGHSVVIGDSALGTANAQTLLGAQATSNQANSVALGFASNAARGAQIGYTAYGLAGMQASAGEVAVGAAGNNRQITHVAAGSAPTDAVNLAQLQGAIAQVGTGAADARAVRYDLAADGQPDYARVTLGNGAGAARLGGLLSGTVAATSTEAVNGAQLDGGYQAIASILGAGAQADGGVWAAPRFQVATIGADGRLEVSGYTSVGAAFDAVSGTLGALSNRLGTGAGGGAASPYLAVNSSGAAATATGSDGVALGASAYASASGSVAVGLHAQARAQDSVALGAGSVADRAGTVSVGSASGGRQIVNVADGTEAGDAVNLRQLQSAEQRSVQYASAEDGGIDYSALVLGRPTASSVRVQNVAAGRAETDAVNYAQLNQAMAQGLDSARAYTDDRFFSVNRQIRRVDDRASAGIASALAVAGLPQPSAPGSNMASVAVGGFNGESGMAVGISGITESGRWIYKLSGTTNTRGEGGFSVGAGIQW